MAGAICLYGLHRDEILGFQKASWEERMKEGEFLELKKVRNYLEEESYLTQDMESDIEFIEQMEGLFGDY
jgi:hypothetical protein